MQLNPFHKKYRKKYRQWLLSDKTIAKKRFLKTYKRKLDLANPQTFNEKLHWINLYDRNPLMTICADKYKVRKYVADKAGSGILNELYAVYENANDIDFANLPKPCVLKVNHGCGQNLIVKESGIYTFDGCLLSVRRATQTLNKMLKENRYTVMREWCYKNINPKIVCEKFIQNENETLFDYKFFCFGGEARFIQVDVGRHINHTRVFFNTKWDKQNFSLKFPMANQQISPPACLAEMLKITQLLSSEFVFVRVDLYNINESPIFGEMTFVPENGDGIFGPPHLSEHWDLEFGKLIKLPIIK